MSETYDFGDDVYCEGEFRNSAGVLANPENVFAKTVNPQGTPVTYQYGVDAALTRPSTGIYWLKVDANKPGKWKYRIYATGTGKAAARGEFTVNTEW